MLLYRFCELADRSDPWNLVPFMNERAGCLDSCRSKTYQDSVIQMWDQYRTKYLAPGEVKKSLWSFFFRVLNYFFLSVLVAFISDS